MRRLAVDLGEPFAMEDVAARRSHLSGRKHASRRRIDLEQVHANPEQRVEREQPIADASQIDIVGVEPQGADHAHLGRCGVDLKEFVRVPIDAEEDGARLRV